MSTYFHQGTDKILDCLMHTMDNDASYMLNAIHCLRMPSNARNALANILYNVHPDDLLYVFNLNQNDNDLPFRFTILIAKHQLVNCLRPRRHVLNPQGKSIFLCSFIHLCRFTYSHEFREQFILIPQQ